MAEEIRKLRVEKSDYTVEPLGKCWTSRFLARNPSLQSKVAKSIEVARKEVTEVQIQNWFNVFKRVVEEDGILPENIYNMYETDTVLHMIIIDIRLQY